jgi:pimeloyl-ACP methyl ester carboxylesterase
MSAPSRDPYDLRGLSRLAVDATVGVTDLVEAMHRGIARPWPSLRATVPTRTRGLTGWIYRSIRWVTRRVGRGLDATLAAVEPALDDRPTSPRRESFVAALNGVVGDYLEATGNPLAIPLRLRHQRRDLPLAAEALAAAVPDASSRVVVLVHGLCRSDRHWRRRRHDHGEELARELGATPVYVRYNSGRHVSTNARDLAEALESMVAGWPVPVDEIAIVGHSMGGLVARAAVHYAERAEAGWPRRLRHLIFLGTPHHGAPLERGGLWLHRILGAVPYARPLGRLGRVRSAGITDLRYGNLIDEDWQGHDRFAHPGDRRRPLPLPDGVTCCAVAATTRPEAAGLRARLLGDGLVPLESALGRHPDPAFDLAIPPERLWIARGTGHLDLLARREVYARIRDWLTG